MAPSVGRLRTRRQAVATAIVSLVALGGVAASGSAAAGIHPTAGGPEAPAREGQRAACALNGAPDATGRCVCDPGWRGPRCAALDVRPAAAEGGGLFGLRDTARPTWGGGGVLEDGRWHLIVGPGQSAPPTCLCN